MIAAPGVYRQERGILTQTFDVGDYEKCVWLDTVLLLGDGRHGLSFVTQSELRKRDAWVVVKHLRMSTSLELLAEQPECFPL